MKADHLKSLRVVAALLTIVSIAGCAFEIILRSAYDKSADFSAYTSWNFVAHDDPDYEVGDSLLTQSIRDATAIAMEGRGYTQSDSPDLLVSISAAVKFEPERRFTPPAEPVWKVATDTDDPTTGNRRVFSYGTHLEEFPDVTFNIRLFDSAKQQLAWEAVGSGRISGRERDRIRRAVMKHVRKLFAMYPFVAGSGLPDYAERICMRSWNSCTDSLGESTDQR